jgi:hypothetical protein
LRREKKIFHQKILERRNLVENVQIKNRVRSYSSCMDAFSAASASNSRLGQRSKPPLEDLERSTSRSAKCEVDHDETMRGGRETVAEMEVVAAVTVGMAGEVVMDGTVE